ncbi:hypothetical protein Tco_0609438 [Tanacetum coccineum]
MRWFRSTIRECLVLLLGRKSPCFYLLGLLLLRVLVDRWVLVERFMHAWFDECRGVVMDSDLCPVCGLVTEDIAHVLFRCDLAGLTFRKICRWWELDWHVLMSFEDWNDWFLAIWLSSKVKLMLEGVCYVAWWHIWAFRNHLSLVDRDPPPRLGP